MSFKYNDVVLQECKTLEFKMEQERDPTGTDSLWNKYTVRVRGFISQSESVFRTDTSTAIRQLKNRLETPRRTCSYSVGGVTLVAVDTPALDAKLGPEPLPATVYQVTSGTYMVEAGFIVRLVDCDNVCEVRSPVLSLRWTQTESFDENWYSNLLTSGKLIVRSDLLQSADSFRPLATPPLLNDYRRKMAKYTLSPDGLQLDFEFQDVEEDRLPPYPATKASGYFTTSIEKVARRTGTVHVELEGQKGTSRQALMIRAVAMCYSKLESENLASDAPAKFTPVILKGQFQEDLFVPKVKAEMTGLLPPLVGRGLLGAGARRRDPANKAPKCMNSVGVPPAGVGQNQPGIAPPDRKRLAALLAAAFRDPCACAYGETSMTTTGRTPSYDRLLQNIPKTNNPPAIIEITTTQPQGSATNVITDTAPYDTYLKRETTTFDSGKTLMPGTGMGQNGSVGQVVTVHGGFSHRMVEWVASRTGSPPVLPAFETGDPGVVPLKGSIVAKEVVPSADGAALNFMVAGWYLYAVTAPLGIELSMPSVPFTSAAVAAAAKASMSSWDKSGAADKGTVPANPFVPGGVTEGTPPAAPLGFDTLPLSALPVGGFQDLSGAASGGGGEVTLDDPFFNPPGFRGGRRVDSTGGAGAPAVPAPPIGP